MKIAASKTIEIVVHGCGRYYFPDDQTLTNKKIISVVPIPNMYGLLNKREARILTNDMSDIYLNLTTDGSTYFIKDMPLTMMTPEAKRGLYDKYNMSLSIYDCYVEVTGNVDGVLVLTVFYECEAYSKPMRNTDCDYDSCEILIKGAIGYSQLPDNRNLADKRFRNIYLTLPTVTPLGHSGVDDVVMQRCYISLVRGSIMIHERLPISLLYQRDVYEEFDFENIEFDFENSYIQNTPVASNIIPDNSYLLLTFKFERE